MAVDLGDRHDAIASEILKLLVGIPGNEALAILDIAVANFIVGVSGARHADWRRLAGVHQDNVRLLLECIAERRQRRRCDG